MIMGRAGKETAPRESDIALVRGTEGESGRYRVAVPPLQPVHGCSQQNRECEGGQGLQSLQVCQYQILQIFTFHLLSSIVQFPNEACTSTSGTYSNG